MLTFAKTLGVTLIASGLLSCSINTELADQSFDSTFVMMPHNSYEYQLGQQSTSGLALLLDKGYRSLEIDIFSRDGSNDDFVGHNGYQNSNNCRPNASDGSLEECLSSINLWIAEHDFVGPITLFIDLKDMTRWNLEEFALLEQTLAQQFKAAGIVHPHEVLSWTRGKNPAGINLRQSVARDGWPSLNEMDQWGKVIVFYTAGTADFYQQVIDSQGENLVGFPCPGISRPSDFDADQPVQGMSVSASAWVVCGNVQWREDKQAQQWLSVARDNHQVNHIWEIEETINFDHLPDLRKALDYGAQFINRDDAENPNLFQGQVPMQGTLD